MGTVTPPGSFEQEVAAARAGDDAARERVITRLLPDLRAYVRLKSNEVLRLRESTSDLVQSACREVLGDLSRWQDRGPGSFRAWVFAVVLHKIRQKHQYHCARKRNPGREVSLASEDKTGVELYARLCRLDPSPSELAMAREQARRLEAAVDRLPDDYREVLLLRQLQGLSHRQVAEKMGRSEGAVRVLVTRARIKLLAALEGRS